MKKLAPLFAWLQKAITHIWRFLLGIILTVLAIFLLLLAIPFAVIFYFATIGEKRQNIGEILVSNGSFFKLVAIGIDILGNIIGSELFNWVFLKRPEKFPFGFPGDKISSVLELNFRINNLNDAGAWLKNVLDRIEKDHCRKSVEEDQKRAEYLINNL